MIPHGAGGAAQGMSVLVRPAHLSTGHVQMSFSTVAAGPGGVVLVYSFLSHRAATPVWRSPCSFHSVPISIRVLRGGRHPAVLAISTFEGVPILDAPYLCWYLVPIAGDSL